MGLREYNTIEYRDYGILGEYFLYINYLINFDKTLFGCKSIEKMSAKVINGHLRFFYIYKS